MVSLDFGSKAIRALGFTSGRRGTKVTMLAQAPLPPGAIAHGVIVMEDVVTQAIRDLWAENKFKTKEVVFSVANDDVLARDTAINWLSPDEFGDALPHQVADETSTLGDHPHLGWHQIDEFDEVVEPEQKSQFVIQEVKYQRKSRILLVAAEEAMLDRFVHVITESGLTPLKADLKTLALLRAVTASTTPTADAQAIVDIGAETMNISVFQHGQPLFVRTIADLGSASINSALSTAFGWSDLDAEHTKVTWGLGEGLGTHSSTSEPSVFGVTPTTEVEDDNPAYPVIAGVASQFISQIRETMDFALMQAPDGTRISRIYLAGGGSLLQGFRARVASELGVDVDFCDPWSVLDMPGGDHDPEHALQWASATGMTIGV